MRSWKGTTMQLNRANIWNWAQNKPTLVARDMEEHGVPKEVTYAILLARGVFKWLACRRDLIRVKDVWKRKITKTIDNIRTSKVTRSRDRLYWYRGYLKALEECRADVREICHSDRWQAPDSDREAQKFLWEQEIKSAEK